MSTTAKVTFFVMSYKGFFNLKSFVETFGTAKIDFVVAAKDSNVLHDYYSETQQLCSENNIVFYDRKSTFSLTSAYAFAISWRWLIHTTSTTLIVFHDSLLPKYRGFAPLATALINGEEEVGVTALFASAEYDRGDIIGQKTVAIRYPIKIDEAISLVAPCYFDLIKDITNTIFAGKKVEATEQDEREASYSLWLDDRDYAINWNNSADFIKRFIDSIGYPFKGAKSTIDGKLVRILDAEVEHDVDIPVRHTGKIIFVRNGKPIIVCGTGLLQINKMVDDEDNSLLPLKKFRSRFE